MADVRATPSQDASRYRWLVAVVVSVLMGLGVTALVDERHNADALAADFAAHRLVTVGDISAPENVARNYPLQFARVGDRWVSNRAPALILWQVPFQTLLGGADFSPVPGRVAAVAATTATAALLFLALAGLVAPRTAAGAALVLVFASATWAVSGRHMMPHTLGQLAAAGALLALQRGRLVWAGASFGAGILARPVLAVVPLVVGVHAAWNDRSWRPLVAIGGPSLLGLLLLAVWNALWFGDPSVTGGYPEVFADRLVEESVAVHAATFVGMFVDPHNGLLTWSPFLILLVPGVPSAWRGASSAVRGSALAGCLYLVLHARLERVSGGLAFDYRYQLEPLTLAAPLLVLSYLAWTRRRPLTRAFLVFAVVLSVGLQASYIFGLSCVDAGADVRRCSLWRSR